MTRATLAQRFLGRWGAGVVLGFVGAMTPMALTAAATPAGPSKDPRTAAASLAATLDMVEIPGGAFQMGEPPPAHDILDGAPRHAVTVPAFRLGRYDITFAQYDAFARASGRPLPDDEGWGRADRPVINVTWRDVHDFIDWLNHGSGRHFRLPSEAEWEYADRAGTQGNFWWGTTMDGNFANTQLGGGRDIWPYTSPVGSFPANPFGLYDMQGNVAQRVEDCYHHSYEGAPEDGSAWVSGVCQARVVRGGSWFTRERASHAASRGAAGEEFASMALGFRLAEDGGR